MRIVVQVRRLKIRGARAICVRVFLKTAAAMRGRMASVVADCPLYVDCVGTTSLCEDAFQAGQSSAENNKGAITPGPSAPAADDPTRPEQGETRAPAEYPPCVFSPNPPPWPPPAPTSAPTAPTHPRHPAPSYQPQQPSSHVPRSPTLLQRRRRTPSFHSKTQSTASSRRRSVVSSVRTREDGK